MLGMSVAAMSDCQNWTSPRISSSGTPLESVRALAQDRQGGVDLAALALAEDHAEHLPDVLHRFEVIAPVPQHVHDAHDPPALELAQARADVRPGDGERRGELLGVERLRR